MARTPRVWIGTSWKMNKTLVEARNFAARLASAEENARIQRFIIPPCTALRAV